MNFTFSRHSQVEECQDPSESRKNLHFVFCFTQEQRVHFEYVLYGVYSRLTFSEKFLRLRPNSKANIPKMF